MKRLLFLFWLVNFVALEAQPPDKFCTKFGGDGVDIGYSVKETYDRQYIILGSTTSHGNNNMDAYMILIDSMGNPKWDNWYGGAGSEAGKSVIINPLDSGFIFTGFTSSFGNVGYNVYVVRTDKSGGLIWQQNYGGSDWDFGNDVALDNDGNIVVCGSSYSGMRGKNDGYLIKVDMNTGQLLWEKYKGGIEDDEFNRLRITSDGKITVAGNTRSYGDINNDFWLFKVKHNGDSLASLAFGNASRAEYLYDFIEDNNHQLVFCGSYDTSYYNVGKNVAYALRTDLDGVYESEYKQGAGYIDDDKFLAVSNSRSGNFYLFSRKWRHESGSYYGIEVQPVLTDYDYKVLFAKTFGETDEDFAYSVVDTKDVGFMMVGSTRGFGSKSEDILVLKTNLFLEQVQYIVNVPENRNITDSRIYYLNGVIYFENPERELLNYEIIDAQGAKIVCGQTSETEIRTGPELKGNVYCVLIDGNIRQMLKFIAN